MKQYIVDRHTVPGTPSLNEVPNEKIKTYESEALLDADLTNIPEDEIVATESNQSTDENKEGNPLGTILALHSNAVPYGYLPCNGVAFDENQYPALYAMLGDNHTPDVSFDLGADWNNAESITLSTSDYVAPENGWIVGYGTIGTDGEVYITVNNILVSRGGAWIGHYSDRCSVQIKVNKGDVVKSSSNFSEQDFHFVPFKKDVHYVIKATSGLSESQQDYVLDALLEAGSYSTEEVATGKKWIDGKPIYRKTFDEVMNLTTSFVEIPNSSGLNIDSITYVTGSYEVGNKVLYDTKAINYSNDKLYYVSNTNVGTSVRRIITVEYTKTN